VKTIRVPPSLELTVPIAHQEVEIILAVHHLAINAHLHTVWPKRIATVFGKKPHEGNVASSKSGWIERVVVDPAFAEILHIQQV